MERVRIRDPGWKKDGSGIRDKHPGSATLVSTHIKSNKLEPLLVLKIKRCLSKDLDNIERG
jgi:hypothetical protein